MAMPASSTAPRTHRMAALAERDTTRLRVEREHLAALKNRHRSHRERNALTAGRASINASDRRFSQSVCPRSRLGLQGMAAFLRPSLRGRW